MSNQHDHLCTCGCCGNSTAPTTAGINNMPGLSALQYRAGTHAAFKQAMLQALSNHPETRQLTARMDDDLTVATIDAWATVLDVLTFYQERIVNENYLRTATERLSVIELAKHISYKPKNGVAAATYLAFSMNEAAGAPQKAMIAAGTKVQSIPEQDQNPQVFETSKQIEAHVAWNSIKLRTKIKKNPEYNDTVIYLEGVTTGLNQGDGLLIIGDERSNDIKNENWDFRKAKEIVTDNINNFTTITLDRALGTISHGKTILPAAKNVKVYALRQKTALFGHNAPDWRTMPERIQNEFKAGGNVPNDPDGKPEWPGMTIKAIARDKDNMLFLDALYPKVVKDSWIVVTKSDYEEVYKVEETKDAARKNFSLASKSTRLKIQGENLSLFNEQVREVVVYAQSEALKIAYKPVIDAINSNTIILEKKVPGLFVGQKIFISGKKNKYRIPDSIGSNTITVTGANEVKYLAAGDIITMRSLKDPISGIVSIEVTMIDGFSGRPGIMPLPIPVGSDKEDEVVSELHTIAAIGAIDNYTRLTLEQLVSNYFDLPTVAINANVVEATHGETKKETMGSGSGSQVFQKFKLKQKPLTFVSAPTAAGNASTIQVRVNDLLWKEVPSFFGIQSKEKVYTTSIANDGTVTLQFGDGVTGARLPTGTENIKAVYRMGIGMDGLLNAGQLSMLATPQLGVNKVTNPLPSAGAQDPETIEEARYNAPLTVLTLDRIVSIKDYEDFVRAFAGISKARADSIWNGENQSVYITIAAADKNPVNKQSGLYNNLSAAIRSAGHTNIEVYIENYTLITFSISAAIAVKGEYTFEKVKEQVIEKLKTAFSFEAGVFAKGITPAEIIAVIQEVEGVVYTDLQLINNTDPMAQSGFRLIAQAARIQQNVMLPAELLVINNNITITEIVP